VLPAAVSRTGKSGLYIATRVFAAPYTPGRLTKLTQDLAPQMQALRDIGASAELAVMLHESSEPSVTAVVKEAFTGAPRLRIRFDPNYLPRQMVRVPDSGGNGADQLAVLGIQRTNGTPSVEIRDGHTGRFVRRIDFDRGFTPLKLAVMPDVNGNGTPDLALLTSSQNQFSSSVELRDGVTGALIRRIGYPGLADYKGKDFVVLSDSNGNGSPELAALGCAFAEFCNIEIRDALTGERLSLQRLGTLQIPRRLVALPDSSSGGAAELAVLSVENSSERDVNALVFKAVSNAGAVRSLPFTSAGQSRDMAAVPDLDGNGYPELVVAKINVRPGQGATEIKDGLTGALITNFTDPSADFVFQALAVSADLNGNGSAEIVVLQQRLRDRKVLALIRDGRTGGLIRSLTFR
jgi:hypothetical protein